MIKERGVSSRRKNGRKERNIPISFSVSLYQEKNFLRVIVDKQKSPNSQN